MCVVVEVYNNNASHSPLLWTLLCAKLKQRRSLSRATAVCLAPLKGERRRRWATRDVRYSGRYFYLLLLLLFSFFFFVKIHI